MTLAAAWRIGTAFAAAHWRAARLHGPRLRRYQDARARQMTRFAHARSPFYREHWAAHDIADWRVLPAIDKTLMMANFDRFTTVGVPREAAMQVALRAERSRDFSPTLDGLTIGLSSGTSGHRGLFVVSAAEQAAWAGTIVARLLPAVCRRGFRVAFFLRSNSNLYEQTNSRLVRFRYFDLMLPIAEAVAGLNAYEPEIVVGPPSLLGMLAAARRAGTLRIRPERLIAVAEVLEPQDREALAEAFAAPVHEVYQCTEGLLGLTCARGVMHLQEDLAAFQFEPVGDAAGGRVQPVVTDLHRRSQPIIRYRMGDVLRLASAPCACGSDWQVVEAIEGRADDLLYFDSRNSGTRAFFPDTVRRAVLLADARIGDYQVFQLPGGALRVHLAAPDGEAFTQAAAAVRDSLDVMWAQYDCRAVPVAFVNALEPAPPLSKRRRVRRLE